MIHRKRVHGIERPFSLTARDRGVTLLEVLIALLVLSIGMVGIAALNVSALQNVHSAHYRSLASTIALDFEERLWDALAMTPDGSCPNAAGLITDLQGASSVWRRNTPWLVLPGFSINEGGTIAAGGGQITVPLRISWTERRFADVDSVLDTDGETVIDAREEFFYVVRILCR